MRQLFHRSNSSHSDIFHQKGGRSIISETHKALIGQLGCPSRFLVVQRVWWRYWVQSRVSAAWLSSITKKNSTLSFTVWVVRKSRLPSWIRYNTAFCVHPFLEHTDDIVMMDNEAMHDIGRHNLGIALDVTLNLNCLLVYIISSLTSSLHLEGTLNFDVTEFQTNEVPHPRVMSKSLWPRSSCLSWSLC